MSNERNIDTDEGRDSGVCCHNCGATATGGTWLTPVALDGAILDNAWACDECLEEQERVERHADELAARPSCGERQSIIDAAESAAVLVNRLTAHDQTRCSACAVVASNIGFCDACGEAAPRIHDAAFQLDLCPTCDARARYLDAIIARHNAEMLVVA